MSGSWRGVYSYDDTGESNGFEAVLIDADGAITGETREASDSLDDADPVQCAYLDGSRSGNAIKFVKRYDEIHRAGDPVLYSGDISADGGEISGRWTIHGTWSGSFLMVRASQRETAAETLSATVD